MTIFAVEIDDVKLWQRIIEQAGTDRAITATGRTWGEGDYFADYSVGKWQDVHGLYSPDIMPMPPKVEPRKRVKYYVGQTRAIQPGRTHSGVWYKQRANGTYLYSYNHPPSLYGNFRKDGFHPARIRITSLEKLDVRQMTDEQARRTGFSCAVDYLTWWVIQYRIIRKFSESELHRALPDRAHYLTRFIYDGPMDKFSNLFIGFEFVEAE